MKIELQSPVARVELTIDEEFEFIGQGPQGAPGLDGAGVGDGQVTNIKLAPAPAGTIKGNASGVSAAPSDLTAAQVKTMLAIASGDVSGLGALATVSSVSLTTQATGTLQAAQAPALSGDVTSSAGALATTIAAGAVSLNKMANLTANTILGNNTGSPATPIALSAAQVKALLAIASGDVSGLGALATASNVSLTTQATGTLQAAQAPALSGDVTSSAGALATTIAAGAVSLPKMANMATASLIYRKTAGSGAPEVNTLATLKTDLGLTGTNSGDQTVALTGDVTGSGTGSFAATIASGVVSNAKLATMAATTLKGNATGATAAPTDLTGTQATALLDAFTSAAKGLAPASGGGTANFLRADGTWAAPAGGGSTTLTGDVTGSGTGSFATTIAAGAVSLPKMANLTANTILGNNTGSPATPIALSAAQVKALLAIASGDVSGLGALATASSVSLTTQATGTLQAAQAPALSGDVTSSAGALATTIAAGAVSLPKMANMATASLIYRKTAGSGAPEVNTLATLKTDLGLTGTNSGDQTVALTGDVTGSGTGSFAATIASGVISNAKLATMAATTLKGNATGATAAPTDLTGTQATALLDAFTSAAKGLAPASGGGTANFLRADGTWAAPAGGGSTTLTGDVTGSGTGSFATTIAAGAVSLNKMANLTANTILGNNTGSPATPIALSAAQVKALLAIASGDVSGLGALATASNVSLTTQATGTLQAAQAPALSGDVTSSAGALATTIAAGAVSLPKMANMATASLIYRKTAGSGAPEVNTLATLKTDLGLTGTNSGDQTVALTGDVTGSGTGSFAATIASGVVSNAKLATMAATTLKGNATGATAAPTDLTGTQATALLDAFTSAAKGLAPASGGGTANFLRADGTWAAPAGGGGGGGDVYLANTQTFTGLNEFTGETDLSGPTFAVAGSSGFTWFDQADVTKQVQVNLTGQTTSTVRTLYTPDASGFLSLAPYYGVLTSNYTLTSSTSVQKAFNFGSGSGGALTLGVGYHSFECLLLITTMSATSGNAQFDLKGAGSATLANIGLVTIGADSSTPTTTVAASSGGGSVAATTAASMVTAGTGTGMWALVRGTFQVTAGGTIVPSLKLVTANAAVVNAGSYFSATFIGTGSTTGTWT